MFKIVFLHLKDINVIIETKSVYCNVLNLQPINSFKIHLSLKCSMINYI